MTFNRNHYDAVIVGARCAGAATGMLLARAGASVLLVDRAPEIGDMLSTHALTRPAVMLLDRWGLLEALGQAGTPWVERTAFIYGSETVDIPLKPFGRARGLLAPRRFVLDRVLGTAARQAGAELRTGVTFEGVTRSTRGRVDGALLRVGGSFVRIGAGIVIGADGRMSAVAQSVGAATMLESQERTVACFGYFDGLPNEGYRWFYDTGIAAGLIPTNGGQHCVFVSCRPEEMRVRLAGGAVGCMAGILSRWDESLAGAVHRQGPATRLRRFPGAPGFLRAAAGPGWALVGDAGCFKDPLTAHGITDAFLDAQGLATVLAASPGDGAAYQAGRDAHARPVLEVTERIASFDWTLAELQALHMRMAACVKAEAAGLAGMQPLAA